MAVTFNKEELEHLATKEEIENFLKGLEKKGIKTIVRG